MSNVICLCINDDDDDVHDIVNHEEENEKDRSMMTIIWKMSVNCRTCSRVDR